MEEDLTPEDADPGQALEPPPRRPWGRPALLSFAVLVVIGLAGAFGYGLTHDPSEFPSALVGHRAPDFNLETLDGRPNVHLRALRGHVVVINFWASWCYACFREHPNLVAAWQRYGDAGVDFIGVLYQDRVGLAENFMRRYAGGWPNLLDPGGRTAIDYGVRGVPETFFIDRRGIVRFRQVGYSSYDLLSTQIARLLRLGSSQ